jgi:transketolase
VEQRYLSYGWQVLHVDDGDKYAFPLNSSRFDLIRKYRDLESIYTAIVEAQKEKSKPTLIRLRTTIGYGSKQQGTHGVHGARMC